MCELAVGDPTRPVARPVLRLYPYSRAFIPTNVRDVCVGSRSMTLLVRSLVRSRAPVRLVVVWC